MAYVSQEMKAKLAPTIRAICKKYGVKASIAVRHHSTLVLNIKSGKIDFIGNSNKVCGNDFYQVSRGFTPNTTGYDQVNPYHFQSHYDGTAKRFMTEMIAAMKGPDFFDHSDIQSDYFHRSHYIDINIGAWNKPYALVK
jgi:hypothetical protein